MIPRPVQDMVLRNVRTMQCKGTALFADVSGFTSMTESLMAYGREGADTLSRILNGVFAGAVEDVLHHGGCVLGFQGDALAAFFPPARHEAALECAAILANRFGHDRTVRTGLGEWDVSIRIGVASGEIVWGILGNSRLVHFTRGGALLKAVELAAGSSPGTFRSDISSLPGKLSCEKCRLSSRIRRTVASRFVPEEILDSRLEGEFRDVVPVFINLRGNPPELDRMTDDCLELSGSYGGYMTGVFFPGGGAQTLVLFGAPLSSEDNASRACDFALELTGRLGEAVRIGLSSGVAYAGITGSSRRCSYSVFGDTVNTAARLVQLCDWGGVLASSSVTSRTGAGFAWDEGGSLKLKGRSTATGVMRLLRRIETGSWDFKGNMVGRRRELNYIGRKLAPLLQGSGCGNVCVYGAAGVGKSRLVSEAVTALGDGCRSFILRCDEMKGKSLGPISGFLRTVFRQGAPSSLEENRLLFRTKLDAIRTELGSVGTRTSRRGLANLSRAVPVLESLLGLGQTLESAEPGEFQRVALAVTALVRSLAMVHPTVLMVEDLQWMDRDTGRLLEDLLPAVSDLPIALLATSRYGDDGSKPRLPDRSECYQTLDLGELDQDGARKLMDSRLSGPVSKELFSLLWAQTGGSPFFIEQFCLFVQDGGMLRSGREGLTFNPGMTTVPSGIRDLLVARMDRLPLRLRELVQTASVLGNEFDARVLASMNGEVNIHDFLDLGVSKRLWTRVSETSLAFEHSLLRGAAYGMLMPGRLRKLHRKAARTILELYREAPDTVAGQVAIHFHNAGSRSDALAWGMKALAYAAGVDLNGEVLDWSERLRNWLEEMGEEPGTLLLDILEKRNQALNTLGRRSEQLASLEDLMEVCSRTGAEERMPAICKHLGDYHYVTGDLAEASGWYSRGMELARRGADRVMEGVLMGNMGILHGVQCRYALAIRHYEEAIDIHRTTGNRRMEGITIGNLAILLRQQGDDTSEEARARYLEALEIHREVGNRSGEGAVLLGLGNLETVRGDQDRAREHYLRALKIDREVGHRRNEGYVLVALGILESIGEDFDAALSYLWEGLDVQREIGDLGGEALVLTHIGITYWKLEDLVSAKRFLTEALETRRRAGDRRGVCIVLGNLGQVLLASGDMDGALEMYVEAASIIQQHDLPQGGIDGVVELHTSLLASDSGTPPPPFPKNWHQPEENEQ